MMGAWTRRRFLQVLALAAVLFRVWPPRRVEAEIDDRVVPRNDRRLCRCGVIDSAHAADDPRHIL